jgi:hypothetical protein
MKRSAELERDIAKALEGGRAAGTRRHAAASQRELFGAAAGALPGPFARSWAAQVRAYLRHVSDLSEGDDGAFDRAIKVKNKLYKMTNSGEIAREAAELLHDHIEGRGDWALPGIAEAREAGRAARAESYARAARGLRASDETLDPRSLQGEMRILRGR